MSTHKLCLSRNREKYQNFLSENFPSLVVKFSIYLNRCIFVMTAVYGNCYFPVPQLRMLHLLLICSSKISWQIDFHFAADLFMLIHL